MMAESDAAFVLGIVVGALICATMVVGTRILDRIAAAPNGVEPTSERAARWRLDRAHELERRL
jgi:hypothetical protein